MSPHSAKILEFLNVLIPLCGWELRYSPSGFPYAALPQGFGDNEQGVKIHFIPNGGSIKVVGVIEHSDKIGVRRPHVYVSIYGDVDEATDFIKKRLLPRYKEAWYRAQPKIAKWLEEHPQP